MALTRDDFAAVADGLKQLRTGTARLTAELQQARRDARAAVLRGGPAQRQASAACSGGSCSTQSAAGSSVGDILAKGISGGLSSAIRNAVRNDFSAALRSMLSSVSRSIASAAGRGAGGGLGGSFLSSLVGGGLSLLVGKLFKQKQRVQVDNTVRAEVLNFPRYTNLDFAANPASRLFGARAIPRGPAFTVEVDYRGGAEDVVTAKVAAKLAEENFNGGLG
jgi:hypothetical protein